LGTEPSRFFGSQPSGYITHKPSGKLRLLSIRPAVTFPAKLYYLVTEAHRCM